MASRYLQFYTAPRVFRITNKEGWPEFVTFSVGETPEGTKVATVQKTMEDGTLLPKQEFEVKGLPDVKVLSGSNLPFGKAQKVATALDLHSRGAITLESLLKSVNWPDAEEETKKVQEEQAAMAQQEVPQ